MVVLLPRPAGDVFVAEVGADETGPLVVGRYPLDQLDGRDVEPAVRVPLRIFPDDEGHVPHVGGLKEQDEILLISPCLHISPRHDEYPDSFASFLAQKPHRHLRLHIVSGGELHKGGPPHDLLRPDGRPGKGPGEETDAKEKQEYNGRKPKEMFSHHREPPKILSSTPGGNEGWA